MTTKIDTTVDELHEADRTAGLDVLGWPWFAEFAMTQIETEDSAVYWYEGGRMRGVAPLPGDEDGWVEIFWTEPGANMSGRKDGGGTLRIAGVREPRGIGVSNIATALESGEVLHRVPRTSISTAN